MANDSDFKEGLMIEYRKLSSRISEANDILQTLTPRLQKLSALIGTYDLHDELAAALDGDDAASGTDVSKSKSKRIAKTASDFFVSNGNKWTRLSELYDHLLTHGIVVGGKNPNSTLSAHLGTFKEFEVERARGWRLTDSAYIRLTSEAKRVSE